MLHAFISAVSRRTRNVRILLRAWRDAKNGIDPAVAVDYIDAEARSMQLQVRRRDAAAFASMKKRLELSTRLLEHLSVQRERDRTVVQACSWMALSLLTVSVVAMLIAEFSVLRGVVEPLGAIEPLAKTGLALALTIAAILMFEYATPSYGVATRATAIVCGILGTLLAISVAFYRVEAVAFMQGLSTQPEAVRGEALVAQFQVANRPLLVLLTSVVAFALPAGAALVTRRIGHEWSLLSTALLAAVRAWVTGREVRKLEVALATLEAVRSADEALLEHQDGVRELYLYKFQLASRGGLVRRVALCASAVLVTASAWILAGTLGLVLGSVASVLIITVSSSLRG